jgi:hypothetical protein
MPPLARSGLTAVPPRLWGGFFNPLTKCSSVRVYFRGESRRFELRRVFSGGTIVFWEKKGFPPFLSGQDRRNQRGVVPESARSRHDGHETLCFGGSWRVCGFSRGDSDPNCSCLSSQIHTDQPPNVRLGALAAALRITAARGVRARPKTSCGITCSTAFARRGARHASLRAENRKGAKAPDLHCAIRGHVLAPGRVEGAACNIF